MTTGKSAICPFSRAKKAHIDGFGGNTTNADANTFKQKGDFWMKTGSGQGMNSGLWVGMAAGAALGAVSVMAVAGADQRQFKRTARKLVRGAENAVTKLDQMVGDFVDQHMDG